VCHRRAALSTDPYSSQPGTTAPAAGTAPEAHAAAKRYRLGGISLVLGAGDGGRPSEVWLTRLRMGFSQISTFPGWLQPALRTFCLRRIPALVAMPASSSFGASRSLGILIDNWLSMRLWW
jgi:hypothetical protein